MKVIDFMKVINDRFTETSAPMLPGLEHLGGKKFAQQGAEYLQKEKAVRRHRTGGRPHGRHRPAG